MPLKKFSEPDDMARAVEYLAAAGNVTGQSMNVDGGRVRLSIGPAASNTALRLGRGTACES